MLSDRPVEISKRCIANLIYWIKLAKNNNNNENVRINEERDKMQEYKGSADFAVFSSSTSTNLKISSGALPELTNERFISSEKSKTPNKTG